jgi:hypothetical protein
MPGIGVCGWPLAWENRIAVHQVNPIPRRMTNLFLSGRKSGRPQIICLILASIIFGVLFSGCCFDLGSYSVGETSHLFNYSVVFSWHAFSNVTSFEEKTRVIRQGNFSLNDSSLNVSSLNVSSNASVKVAVCFAGAWRRWDQSWSTLYINLIESLDADVFAVSDSIAGGGHNQENNNDISMTVDKLKLYFGSRLKGARHFTAEELMNLENLTFPEIVDSKRAGLAVFNYVFKIWQCGQLIHLHVKMTGFPYDVIVRLRPDLSILSKFQIWNTDVSGVFRLVVGASCVEFGQRDVVIHEETCQCFNDWMQIGTYASMSVIMDFARFVTPQSAFLSGDPSYDNTMKQFLGAEPAHNWLAWRTGTRVIRVGMYVTLTRDLKCSDPNCTRANNKWYRPDIKLYGCQTTLASPHELPRDKVDDCSDPQHPDSDLEMWSLPGPFSVRPPCWNVDDLAVHNPLTPCRKFDGNDKSRAPNAHRPHVIKNYGVPLIFVPKMEAESLSL